MVLEKHIFILFPFQNNVLVPILWSLIYEMRISLIMPYVSKIAKICSASTLSAIAFSLTLLSFSILASVNSNALALSFLGNGWITLHYAAFFILGALVSCHSEYLEKQLNRKLVP
jgi:peptidoglycan/LPS O-acetylase OafA/YrhL